MSPVFGHGRLRLYLLKLLDESPRHGYDIIRALEDRFMGLYSPSAGTVYPRLSRLEDEGLVTHDLIEGRKVYRITPAGRSELTAREDELADLEQEISGSVRDLATEIRSEVRASVRDLQAELKAAAKDVRRRQRHERRARPTSSEVPGPAGPPSPELTEIERALDGFLSHVRAALRARRVRDREVAVVHEVLADALARLRRELSDAS